MSPSRIERIASAICSTSSGSTSSAGVADDLRQRRAVGRHDRAAAGHRLERRQAVALVERREDETAGRAVEAHELLVADPPGQDHGHRRPRKLALEVLVAPALAAGDHERHVAAERRDRAQRADEVLARLERADRQHVRPVDAEARAQPGVAGRLRAEAPVDPVGRHAHARGVGAEHVDDLGAGLLGPGDDPDRAAGGAPQEGALMQHGHTREELGMAQRQHVVHGHHERPAQCVRRERAGQWTRSTSARRACAASAAG